LGVFFILALWKRSLVFFFFRLCQPTGKRFPLVARFSVSASLQGRDSRWWRGFLSRPAYREEIPVGGEAILAPQPAYREEIPVGGKEFFGFLFLAALYNVVGIMSKNVNTVML
jgi:hypothetical protein